MTGTNHTINTEDHRIRQRFIEAAVEILAECGYNGELRKTIADRTGYSLLRIRTFFARDEDVVIALYARFASDLESRVTELPEGTVAVRFRTALIFRKARRK